MVGLHGGIGAGAPPVGGDWLVFTPVAGLLACAVAVYVLLTRRTARGWSVWRTAEWLAGCAIVGLAVSPVLAGRGGPVAHVTQHVLLGMVAPLGLVLAAPVTLLLRSSAPGTRRVVAGVLRSRLVHIIGHPVTAAALSVGGLFVVMLTPLYGALERYPMLHHGVHLHYLAAGYLFAWSIAGPDPAPRRPSMPTRVAVLIAATAAHSVLAKLLYAQAATLPVSRGYGIEETHDAAQVMYYAGDLAHLLLATVLFNTWFRHRSRLTIRTVDRRRAEVA